MRDFLFSQSESQDSVLVSGSALGAFRYSVTGLMQKLDGTLKVSEDTACS